MNPNSSASNNIERIEEDQINPKMRGAIASLLDVCFPDCFSGRTYYKQLPSFRFLLQHNTSLIGHLAVDHRMVRLGTIPLRIFGVVDLCVHPQHRRQKIAEGLLKVTEDTARASGADFIILFADDHRLYEHFGFQRAKNICTWLAIDEHKTLGTRDKSLADCLMVRALGEHDWDDQATLDMLGHVF